MPCQGGSFSTCVVGSLGNYPWARCSRWNQLWRPVWTGQPDSIGLLPEQLNVTAVADVGVAEQGRPQHQSENPEADDGAQGSPHAPTLSSLGWHVNNDSS